MKVILKYLFVICFFIYGLYTLSLAIQNAVFSVPETGVLAELYKTKATVLFPLSISLIAQSLIIYIIFKKNNSNIK